MTSQIVARTVTKAAGHPVQEIDPVGVVVAGGEFLVQTPPLIVQGGIEEKVHGPAGELVAGVVLAVLVAPPGVVEVGEIEAIDAFVLHQLE